MLSNEMAAARDASGHSHRTPACVNTWRPADSSIHTFTPQPASDNGGQVAQSRRPWALCRAAAWGVPRTRRERRCSRRRVWGMWFGAVTPGSPLSRPDAHWAWTQGKAAQPGAEPCLKTEPTTLEHFQVKKRRRQSKTKQKRARLSAWKQHPAHRAAVKQTQMALQDFARVMSHYGRRLHELKRYAGVVLPLGLQEVPSGYTREKELALSRRKQDWKRGPFHCFVKCGRPATQWHHVIQLQHGGADCAENKVPLCEYCHC